MSSKRLKKIKDLFFKKNVTQGPRIVTLDIETAPLQSYHWGLWDQNIGLEMINLEWTILSYSAKWLGDPNVIYSDTGGRGVAKVRDDKAILKEIWDILDQADIVIAQNGKAFDIKKINGRLIMNGFPPYSPVKVIDTMLESKKHFNFTSNKLAWLSEHLTSAKKSEHKAFPGFELWVECMNDNPKAWIEMRKYNCIDTVATEELYLKLRPWISNHPNVAIYNSDERPACPKCGSHKVESAGLRHTQIGVYRRFRCKDCQGYCSSRLVQNTKEKRASLLTN